MARIKTTDKKIFDDILKLILSYKKPEKIVIFGSRANDNFKETSDIDIAIFASDWSDTDINIVKSGLEDSIKTPLKIDLVNFYALKKKSLKENILKEGKILYGH